MSNRNFSKTVSLYYQTRASDHKSPLPNGAVRPPPPLARRPGYWVPNMRKPPQGATGRHMVPGTPCHVEEGGVLPPGSSLTDSSVLLRGILLGSPEKVRRRKSPGARSGLGSGLGFGVCAGAHVCAGAGHGSRRSAHCSCLVVC